MKVIASIAQMQAMSLAGKRSGQKIGFVPTMGFLHEGHLSLMRRAREIADRVVVSIFVNPAQFGPGEDFEKYPRDPDGDHRLCEDAGVDVLFRPTAEDMYARDHNVCVDESVLGRGLCGRFRPGHFRGVLTVVAKLFNIVLPDVAVFGQKDAQQARIIEQMATDLNFPVRIVVAPTVREADGLAMSSRNAYLTGEERKRAVGVFQSLGLARQLYEGGTRMASAIKERMKAAIENAMTPVAIDYIEIVDSRTLMPVERIESPALVAVAVRMGGVRLIDNMVIGGETP